MADTISFRPNAEDLEVLDRLGESPTEAIRAALSLARRHLADEELRREAAALASEPTEQADDTTSYMGDVFEELPE